MRTGGHLSSQAAEQEHHVPTNRVRVLLVEDDELLVRSMTRHLRRVGWQVDAVGDGESALEHARAQPYDAMILDVGLPGMNGLAVLEALQREPAPPPVILLSGFLNVKRTLFALQRGAVEVLEKPVLPDRLVEVVGGVVGRARTRTGYASGVLPLDPRIVVPEFVGSSAAAQLLREQVVMVSRFPDLPVMIIGETGTGKELVARALHRLTAGDGRLVSLNCAALPEELFESEVFGHEAGAFTGARGARAGLLEAAGAGTAFLDEVGEMPASQQAKLLRVLETRAFRRVGSNREQPLQARIVSATNRSLRGRDDEALRSDLFFRLAGYTIRTPPLRERMDDLEELARHFLTQFSTTYACAPSELSQRAVEALHTHDWRGNVRELRSVVQFAAVRATHGQLGVRQVVEALRARGCLDDAPTRVPTSPPRDEPDEPDVFEAPDKARAAAPEASPDSLRDVERAVIERVYAECDRNVSGAARRLGIPRSTLRDKLDRYKLR